MSDSELEALQALQDWLDNRQALVDDFKTIVGRSHKKPWPDFIVIGLAQDNAKGVLKPATKGVPEGRIAYTVGEGPPWSVVVELAARVTAVRSRRWDPVAKTVKPIPETWRKLAYEAFPFLCTMSIGDGWADLMIATAGWMSEIGVPAGWRFSDIKEKYGELRLYDGPSDDLDDICTAAERLSECICDACGAPGRLRVDAGWYSTRCDEHA